MLLLERGIEIWLSIRSIHVYERPAFVEERERLWLGNRGGFFFQQILLEDLTLIDTYREISVQVRCSSF